MRNTQSKSRDQEETQIKIAEKFETKIESPSSR